ncbi:MAG: hypothetical protein NTW31_02050 [Bacteroidetes bacterium]|nr:hypothetical protein [Bacteroidota bacterium]
MNNYHRPAAILFGVSALLITCFVASPARAQDKKEQKVTTIVTTTPSKDNKEQKITVVAKSDSRNKDGKVHVRIIKEENGKKTEIDTVISSKGAMEGKELEALMEDVNSKMKDAEEQMKELELTIGSEDDSAMTDSSGHHKYMFKLHGGKCCPKICIKDFPRDFNYNFEMPDMPEPPDFSEEFDQGSFNRFAPGPRVFSMQKRGESLSDVLGDIPMSRVKSYKVIDKKGGKRIIIDLEDGPYFESGANVIYFNGPGHSMHHSGGMKHQKDLKVIIKTDDNQGNDGQPENPPPPAEPKKTQTGSPKI